MIPYLEDRHGGIIHGKERDIGNMKHLFIYSINSYSSAFRLPGQGYEQVLAIMKKHLGKKANIPYDVNSIVIPPTGLRNELNANLRIAPAMYEADMVLTMEQIKHVLQYGRTKRKITTNSSSRWTQTSIPYRWAINDGHYHQY
uniref:DNA-directed DNA polymerase n=1 Tax=Heterorhabditis bacteriophora TaxID=37862 RepID=A0A1I7X5T9_HETBA